MAVGGGGVLRRTVTSTALYTSNPREATYFVLIFYYSKLIQYCVSWCILVKGLSVRNK